MGYTHYWYKEPEIEAETMLAIVADFNRVILPLDDNGIRLAGSDGEGSPEITPELVAFNGVHNRGHPENSAIVIPWPTRDGSGLSSSHKAESGNWFAGASIESRCCDGSCDYESFVFERTVASKEPYTAGDDWDGRNFDCCKTAFRPYDIAVTAFLLIAKRRLGNRIKVKTDGEMPQWWDGVMLCQTVLGYGLEYEIRGGELLPVAGETPYQPKPRAPKAVAPKPTRDISVNETSKLIKKTLSAAFPGVKFSVRLDKYAGGCSINASWTDGPTDKQVQAILDRFNGRGFDGMTDCSYYCGRRMYRGECVDFHSGYVRGGRRYSREFMQSVAERVVREIPGIEVPKIHPEYHCFEDDHDIRVPFQFWGHWLSTEGKEQLTALDLLSNSPILAHDSQEGEYLTRLIDKVMACVSLKPKAEAVELPEYIGAAEVAA